MSRPSTSGLLPPRKPWMPGIADKFTQSAQTAMAGHDEGTCMPTDAPAWSLHSRLKEDTIDLDEVEQAQLMTEISRVARSLKEISKCDKLNIAALGNLVPQLHVHVIARRSSDVAWPRPVWGVMPPLAHDAEEVQNFISAMRRKIWLG